jgi:uncharacterized protein
MDNQNSNSNNSTEEPNKKSRRGFASMPVEKQKAIASSGGKAAHFKGTAHQFSVEEASLAGRKGGATVSSNREHMAEIGRKGGLSRGKKVKEARAIPPLSPSVSDEGVNSSSSSEDVKVA